MNRPGQEPGSTGLLGRSWTRRAGNGYAFASASVGGIPAARMAG
ncbi:hypothetical protein FB559_2680 [Actinoallomurus bryophytorum]|uniref:Uncharacterized protein n=1 Tax=Actinoallomurus bryophytorum TaxID=1490222 RepID=A0A543CJ42_9ACTN|nr:hypothetical protein FB559_2680 [Actinoallomurus bryophytorum]